MWREPPCEGERGPLLRGFQWRNWFDGPYVPRLVHTVAARGRGIHGARLEAGAEEAREFTGANVIGLLDIDGELRERPPRRACVV